LPFFGYGVTYCVFLIRLLFHPTIHASHAALATAALDALGLTRTHGKDVSFDSFIAWEGSCYFCYSVFIWYTAILFNFCTFISSWL